MSKEVKNNKFIGAFVNEMYAILLGIGLGNVLFVQQIDLSNKFEIMMGLFVTGVILLYWWDWTEFLSDNVVSSKAEFIIDFLILINLEVLFLYYNKPINLSIVLIILSVLDLAWVVNYIKQNNGNFLAKNKRWLFEKFFAISLFTGFFFLNKYAISNTKLFYQGFAVIVSFILVRKISFKQVKKATRYNLEEAKESDYRNISQINNSYLNPKENESFMITEMSEEVIKERLTKNYSYFVLRNNGNQDILGFIELSQTVGNEVLEQVTWLNESAKNQILSKNNKLLYVEKIAVDKNYKKQGIGEAIYNNLFNMYKDFSFYAFIMDKPFTNKISMNFHEKIGFKESGTLNLDEFNSFKNYQSKLFYKN